MSNQNQLLTTKQLPEITGLSASYFEKGRILGYGTFRLHDANGKDKRPRKGFARGNKAQRKREEIAENCGSGVSLYVLDETGTKIPF